MPKLPLMYVLRADREPRLVPPWTVSPVVVALPTEIFPADKRPLNCEPPVTLKAEVVALVDQKLVAVRLVEEALVREIP